MSSVHTLTVGIPLFNEEEVLPELLKSLEKVLAQLTGIQAEVLFVDDGSLDRTAQILAEASSKYDWLNYLCLSRNFGHQAALTAVFDHADSDVVVILDGDLQDPPELIPLLLEKVEAGNEVVYVRREGRESLLRHTLYPLYYRLLKLFWRIPVQLDAGDCAAYSRRAVRVFRGMPEVHKFYRGLRSWIGFSQDAVSVVRPKRAAGKSKYSAWKLINLGFDGIFSFSILPIRFALLCGGLLLFLAVCIFLYSLGSYLFTGSLPTGVVLLATLVALTSGINFVLLGVVGEYVGRVYEQVKQRPPYLIRKKATRKRTGER